MPLATLSVVGVCAIMPTDYTLEVRQAVVGHLTQQLTGVDVYGEFVPANPSWPFIRYSSTTLPWEATCYSGSQVAADVHVFANGPSTDQAATIAAEVVQAMGSLVAGEVEWVGNIGPLPDEGPDKWHIVVQFRIVWS